MLNNYIHYAPEAWLLPVAILIVFALYRSWILLGIALVVGVVMLAFYRGASKAALQKAPANTIICPCDGRVLRIAHHPSGWTQIAIFLNIHNIHVQYMPMDGTIKTISHKPGTFHPAYLFEKSQYNERMDTVLSTRIGDVRIVQIAGLVARRIVAFHKPEKQVRRGDPMGLIKFGSRVDVWLPQHRISKLLTSEGQRIRIGDPLAEYCTV